VVAEADNVRCQYKIRWTSGTDAQCEKPHHIDQVLIAEAADKRFAVTTIGDGVPGTEEHFAHVGGMRLSWQAGDRREFTGEWPGECTLHPAGCTLPSGHHGRCAP
jgi:hypothetical protein